MFRRFMRWLGYGAEKECGHDWEPLATMEMLCVFQIGEYQIEAHTLTCPDTAPRARMIGAQPYRTSREVLELGLYAVYEHSCIREEKGTGRRSH